MNEPAALSADLNVITAEINAYQRVAGEAIFEIGRRLKHVKENDLAHGEWERWCREDLGMSRDYARRYVRVFEEFEGKHVPGRDISLKALYEIAQLPPEHRDQPHTVPSTGATKTVDEMTVRELREVKKALKEAESQANQARRNAERLADENVALRDTLESMSDSTVRIVDESNRQQFYADFIDELEYIRSKYGAIALEGARLREYVEYDADKCRKLDDFDDFWQAFSKAILSNQTIIEMGNA